MIDETEINTDRCSPVEMRKNLEVVDGLKKAGIDFVAMPVLNPEDKQAMLGMSEHRLKMIMETFMYVVNPTM